MSFEEAFLRLNGREPTGEEKRDALMIQDVVRGADLDPVLLVFLALGKYETLYRQGAQRITTAVEEAALQAAAIGERVGRERAERAAVEGTMRKLSAAIERQATTDGERTRRVAFGAAIAMIVAGAVVLALSLDRMDRMPAGPVHLITSDLLPPWGWVTLGVLLTEMLRLSVRFARAKLPTRPHSTRTNLG